MDTPKRTISLKPPEDRATNKGLWNAIAKQVIDYPEQCVSCGIGFILPSGRCDHCNMDFAPIATPLAPTPLTTALDARLAHVACGTAYRKMREHAEEMEREKSLFADALDLARDDLRRIKACPGCDSEIAQLCDRAMLNIVQRVPVIVQRDNAEAKLRLAMGALRICRNALFIADEEKHSYAINEADRVMDKP